jgi:hypothetical protein
VQWFLMATSGGICARNGTRRLHTVCKLYAVCENEKAETSSCVVFRFGHLPDMTSQYRYR